MESGEWRVESGEWRGKVGQRGKQVPVQHELLLTRGEHTKASQPPNPASYRRKLTK